MKAKEAPEKIYVDSKAIGDDVSTTVHTKRQDYPTCTEYTRTDAFLIKALSYLCNKFYFNNVFYGIVSTDFNAMEEMFEDFRKYMEGE